MRVYDPRLGRFLSVDPIAIQYPWNSTYAYAENDPILNVDLDGLEKANSTSALSLLTQGFKTGIHEFTTEIKRESHTLGSKQTYADVWNKATNFSKTAVKDPNKAIKTFDKKLTGVADGISNTAQQYTTKPVMWIISSPDRSREDNLRGLGYGLWKGAELYTFSIFPEVLDEGSGLSENPLTDAKKVLSRGERLDIFYSKLKGSAGASNVNDAIKLINKTLDDVEDLYSGIAKKPGTPSGNDGRMYGILDEKFVTRNSDGSAVARTRGQIIQLDKNGGIVIKDRTTNQILFNKEGKK